MRNEIRKYLPLISLLGLFFILIFRRAWLSDDAYITFRTADNFVSGYGLTWNVGERVQAYTHPLWLLLFSLFYSLTRETYFTGIYFSLVVSMLAVGIFAFGIARSRLAAAIGILILAMSNAFVDYSTSGLENPLTHLLLAVFLILFLRLNPSPRKLFYLSLSASLVAVNRLDALLLCLPVLVLELWQVKPKRRAYLALLAGQLPLLAWELFSIFYYGFPFPNTAYAKLYTGLPASVLIGQGLFYLQESFLSDPLTLAAISAGVAAAWFSQDRRKTLPLAAGIGLYLVYVVRIGGDFMSGRFLTAPLLVAASLLVWSSFLARGGWRPWAVSISAVGLGLFATVPTFGLIPVHYDPYYFPHGIANERLYYFNMTALAIKPAGVEFPRGDWVDEGRQLRAASEKNGLQVAVFHSIGFRGFFAGPRVYIVDLIGLADPLLARLPPEENPEWRIGHMSRELPAGYQETLKSGKPQFTHADLTEFYTHLTRITRGKLLDPNRWKDIWNMNTGMYNGLIAGGHYDDSYSGSLFN